MNRIKSFQRYTGIATVLILWFSVLTAMQRADLSLFGMKPLSSLGTMPISAAFFSIGLILASVTFVLFGHYLKQKYIISRSFLYILYLGQLGQVMSALIPFGGKQPARLIHTVAAFTLAFTIPILLWLFASSQKKGMLRKRAYMLLWLEIAAFVIGIGTFAFVQKGAPFGQILSALAFHVWILFISYDSLKTKKPDKLAN